MNKFLIDENLPENLELFCSEKFIHVNSVKTSMTDSEIWNYAKENDLVIVTKDADFSDRILVTKPPPRIIHIKYGNMRKTELNQLLIKIWEELEALIKNNKLVRVYNDYLEIVK